MVKKESEFCSLESVLRPDSEVEAFLNDDGFWDSLKDDRAIPLQWALEKDATFPIVGKELEILTGKLAIYKAAQVEFHRRLRFSDLTTLLLTVEYLKKNGFREQVKKRERELKAQEDYDWERAYKTILGEMEEKGMCSLDDVLAKIFTHQEELTFALKIDESLITAKLREELPTPITYFLIGPMGSGKSFIQRRLEAWREQFYKNLGLNGYDRLALRDQDNPAKAHLRTLLGGEGLQLLAFYEDREDRRRTVDLWKKRALKGVMFGTPAYFAIRLGWELAKYQWGLLGDIDPIADIGMWINQNFNWIALGVGMWGFSKVYSVYQTKMMRTESEQPEWVANSSSSASVMIGAVDRKDIIGEYTENPDVAPQQRFSKARLLECDGKSLIIEQLSDLDRSNQSIIAQVIQEKELSVGDKGEYTTNIFPFISIGLNPHLKHEVIPPLWDRMKLGYGCVVSNEVSEVRLEGEELYARFIEYAKANEGKLHGTATSKTVGRSKRLDRKFFAFLKYHRKDAKPFSRDAWEKALEVSSMLAEDKDQLLISREFISILNKAIDLANLKDEKAISGQDVLNAALITRSEDQGTLLTQLKKYYASLGELPQAPEAGRVNMLALFIDDRAAGDDPFKREIAEENSLGYVLPIRASVTKGSGSLNVLTSQGLAKMRSLYESQLRELFRHKGIALDTYAVTVDLSKALCHDEAFLPAMYVAVASAKDSIPLDHRAVLLCACGLDGTLEPPLKLNKRLLTAYEHLSQVILSHKDLVQRVNTASYPGLTFSGVQHLDEVLGGIKACAS